MENPLRTPAGQPHFNDTRRGALPNPWEPPGIAGSCWELLRAARNCQQSLGIVGCRSEPLGNAGREPFGGAGSRLGDARIRLESPVANGRHPEQPAQPPEAGRSHQERPRDTRSRRELPGVANRAVARGPFKGLLGLALIAERACWPALVLGQSGVGF